MQETPVQFLGGEDAMEKAYPFSILGLLPAMQETWVGSLGWEDTLGKGKTTHSSMNVCESAWVMS